MEPITLSAVTSAIVTLALDAAKELTPQVAKDTWDKVKGWLGWTDTPPIESLATEVAKTLTANAPAAEKIVAELKVRDVGPASKLASKVTISNTNNTGDMIAGRDNLNFQGATVSMGHGTKFGGS